MEVTKTTLRLNDSTKELARLRTAAILIFITYYREKIEIKTEKACRVKSRRNAQNFPSQRSDLGMHLILSTMRFDDICNILSTQEPEGSLGYGLY